MHLTLKDCVVNLVKMLKYYHVCCAFSSIHVLPFNVICYF